MRFSRLKRYLLVLLIVSLVAAALVGVAIFIIGSAGELEARTLMTALLLGFFSLTGLCASVRFERGMAWLGWLGVLTSLAGLTYSELLVWEAIRVEGFDEIKPALGLGIAGTALGYVSLLFLARGSYRSVNLVVWSTVILVAVIGGSLIAFIITEREPTERAGRALAAAAILAVLGTMLAPLLRKVMTLGSEHVPPVGQISGRGGRHRAKKPDRRPEAKGV